MKKLVLGLAVVALLGLGAAAWSAWAVEGRHRALVDALAQHAHVRLLDARYTRGWLRSSATTSFELRGAAGELYAARLGEAGVPDVRSRVGLHVEQRITHAPLSLWRWLREGAIGAPVVARAKTRVALDNETESELALVFGRLPPLRIDTALRVNGRAEGRVAVAPGRFVWRHLPPEAPEAELAEERSEAEMEAAARRVAEELPETLHVDWRGLTGTLAASDAFAGTSPVSARLELHGIRLLRGDRARRVRDLRLDLELRELASGAPELDWSARVASVDRVRLRPEAGQAEASAPPAPEVTEAATGGGEAARDEGAGTPGSDPEGLVLEGGRASGRLALGRPTTGAVEAELASIRTEGASLGPLRLELGLRAAPPIAGPLVEATLRGVELDTPAGAIRGEGRLRLASASSEAGASAAPLAERLGGEVVLETSARVADWLRVRSPALRRLLDAHAAPAAEGERVRAHLRLEEGGLAPASTTTARRDAAPAA